MNIGGGGQYVMTLNFFSSSSSKENGYQCIVAGLFVLCRRRRECQSRPICKYAHAAVGKCESARMKICQHSEHRLMAGIYHNFFFFFLGVRSPAENILHAIIIH